MDILGRIALATLSLAVVGGLSAPAEAAPAAPAGRASGTSWTTVGTFGGGKHQACKVAVDDGATWKVRNRVVNGHKGKMGAGMTVQKKQADTDETWSSGLVGKGKTSKVGAVRFPKGDADYTLVSVEYGENAGTGGILDLADVGRC